MTPAEALAALRLALEQRRQRLAAREPFRNFVTRWQARSTEDLDAIRVDAERAYRAQRNRDYAIAAAKGREL